jgi:hypothetical protein
MGPISMSQGGVLEEPGPGSLADRPIDERRFCTKNMQNKKNTPHKAQHAGKSSNCEHRALHRGLAPLRSVKTLLKANDCSLTKTNQPWVLSFYAMSLGGADLARNKGQTNRTFLA